MAKAYSTIGTILKMGESVALLEKVCKIKAYPDLGGAPENIESTDLEDDYQTFVAGVQSNDNLEFTCNYTDEAYEDLEDTAGDKLYYQLEMGESGAQGRFRWQGTHSVRVTGGDVNAVREMVITITPETDIEMLEDTNASISLSPTSKTLAPNGTQAITATTSPVDATVVWSSDDEDVATVDDGTVTAVAEGACTITATIKVDGTEYSAIAAIIVEASD